MLSAQDHVDLQNLVWLYTYLIDDLCYSRVGEVFTEDAVFDATAVGGPDVKGLANIVSYWRGASHMTILHLASNIAVRELPDGTVHMSSRSIVTVRAGGVSSAFYEDLAKRTPAGWRIAQRRVTVRGPDFVPKES